MQPIKSVQKKDELTDVDGLVFGRDAATARPSPDVDIRNCNAVAGFNAAVDGDDTV